MSEKKTQGLALTTMDEMSRFGRCATLAGVIGGSSGDQGVAVAVVKIQAGYELGLQPMESIRSFHVIEGKTALSAGAMASRIKQSSKYDYRVVQYDAKACEIVIVENGKDLAPVRYTMDDARTAGVTGKAVWKKYPRNMLFARCISEAARVHCPHLLGTGTLYIPDEIEKPLAATAEVSETAPAETAPVEDDVTPVSDRMWRRVHLLAADDRLQDEVRSRLVALIGKGEDARHGEIGHAIGWCKKYITAQTGEPYSDPADVDVDEVAPEDAGEVIDAEFESEDPADGIEDQPCDGESSASLSE